jgi:predicted PurR-regulated permease PerM
MSQVRRAAQEIEKASSSATPPPTPPGVQRVQVESPTLDAESLLWKGTGSAMTLAGQAVVVVVLTFYFLASGDLYKRKLVHIVGTTLSEKRLTVEILNEIELQFGRYLVVRVEISLIVGVATWLAFWALGMPSPGVWGVAAGILNVVPYLGPTAVASSAAIAGFVHAGTITFAVTVGLAASAIAAAEGFILTPTLMGRAGRMNGVAVFIALTVWGFLWGICGLLLAVPITMAIKVICDHVAELQGISELLAE